MRTKIMKHNRPATTLIKLYCDKKSGKVSDARRELQRRFDSLDWNLQKKILMAHLQGSPSDREWAYLKMLSLWDDSFLQTVKEVWEEYHEERCSWVVVRHFPPDYVLCHQEELSIGRNYLFICLRLGGDKDFHIDKSKLLPLDYLSAMANLHRQLSTEETMDVVCRIAQGLCSSTRYWENEIIVFDRIIRPSLVTFRAMDKASYYISLMDDKAPLQAFSAWNDKIGLLVEQSEDYLSLQKKAITDRDYNRQVYQLLIRVIYDNLPHRYKNCKQGIQARENSIIGMLTKRFDLEEV